MLWRQGTTPFLPISPPYSFSIPTLNVPPAQTPKANPPLLPVGLVPPPFTNAIPVPLYLKITPATEIAMPYPPPPCHREQDLDMGIIQRLEREWEPGREPVAAGG